MISLTPRSTSLDQSGAGSESARLLGKGRSGQVYLRTQPDGRQVAAKVFGSEGLVKVVQYAALGAPNPYIWNRNAVYCAIYRRRVLVQLVNYWFDGELRVAAAHGFCWNERHKAYELRTELVRGSHVALHHSLNTRPDGQLAYLVKRVMGPLQEHLITSGFDGLVWQAGRGNPVALNNFLLEHHQGRWVWIDLESGVPALFPINPLRLFEFYLPKSLKHRRPLFDDVDMSQLGAYVAGHLSALESKIGSEGLKRLTDDIHHLHHYQSRWKSMSRTQSSIAYHDVTGLITTAEAHWYGRHLFHWYGRMSMHAIDALSFKFSRAIIMFANRVISIDYLRLMDRVWCYVTSQRYRTRVARKHVSRRIEAWADRGQLTVEQANALHLQLEGEDCADYVTDFGAHMAIKSLTKIIQWCVLPCLFGLGLITQSMLLFGIVVGGPLARIAYVSGRLIESGLHGREKPWIALAASAVPILGNAAYPLQIIGTGAGENRELAQFIIYDTLTHIGQRVPIWGGPDTLTEHAINRLGDYVLKVARVSAALR